MSGQAIGNYTLTAVRTILMTNHGPDTPSEDRSGGETTDRRKGIPVPEEHAGAFVAEVFEDAERATAWADVVDAMVAPSAREEWNALTAREQVTEVLRKAAAYDQEAIDILDSISLDQSVDVSADIAEAKRCRNNADTFRDGVADAFTKGHIDGDEIVDIIETADFDTDRIARREELLERVASTHEVEFRPYGGTLVQEGDRETASPVGTETW